MRIAFVVGSFPETSTTFLVEQIVGLLERGHDVEVFARTPDGPQKRHPLIERHHLVERTHYWSCVRDTRRAMGQRTVRLFMARPRAAARAFARSLDLGSNHGDLALTSRLWPYASMVMSQRPYDLVLAHFGPNAVIAQRLREVGAFAAPLVSVFHGYDLSRIVRERGRRYYRRLFATSELFLPVSDYFRERLIELGCPPERIRVQRMGVDTRAFEFAPRSLTPGVTPRIVSVSRMVPKKGLEMGLRAMALLSARGIDAEWHVLGDGPERPALEDLRQKLGLEARVTFHGAQDRGRVQELLASAHLFLAPSVTAEDGDQEGIPVAIMEAMAVGLPVVSTLHSGIAELVRDGESGYLVREWDVAGLAERIVDLLRHQSDWPEMGARGRRIVEAGFDINRLNDTLSQTLADVSRR